jgi:hypothetical protein
LGADDAADDALGVAAVLRAVRGIELVVDLVGLDEKNVLVDAPGLDVGFVYTAEPGSKSEEALNLLASWTASVGLEAPAGAGASLGRYRDR